jgi:hypothetical protein
LPRIRSTPSSGQDQMKPEQLEIERLKRVVTKLHFTQAIAGS